MPARRKLIVGNWKMHGTSASLPEIAAIAAAAELSERLDLGLCPPFTLLADAARTREGGGVGLGLYLCRLVVQAHGGSFMVRNTHTGLEACVNLPELAPTAAT